MRCARRSSEGDERIDWPPAVSFNIIAHSSHDRPARTRLPRTGTITTMDTLTSPSSSLPNTRAPQRANRSATKLALIGLVVGFAIGLLTAIAQYVLPDGIEQIANSSAMWVVIAFVMGCYARSLVMAILAGTLALFGELAGFYAIAWRLHLAITPLLV